MWQGKSNKEAVTRRIGGLEKPPAIAMIAQIVTRRIGGLEILDIVQTLIDMVTRRIGGLEIFRRVYPTAL